MAIVGFSDRGCADQVSVDAGPIRRLSVRTAHAYWLREAGREDREYAKNKGAPSPHPLFARARPQKTVPREKWGMGISAIRLNSIFAGS
jgi:hypothetical protein